MSGLLLLRGLGGGSQSTTEPRVGALTVQTSAYGMTVPLVWGCQRVSGNLIWYGDFTPIPHTESQQGGKGGHGPTSTTFTYTTSFAMAICEGEIEGIGLVWQDSTLLSQTQSGGTPSTALEEKTIPSGTPFIATISNSDTWTSNIYVQYPLGDMLIDVSPADPTAAGQYKVSGGVYTFSDADADTAIMINYNYLAGASSASALGQLNLTLFTGSATQGNWGYLTSKHPDQAIPYQNTAYVATGSYDLQQNTSLPNHSFEVLSKMQYSESIVDANPADVIRDFLTNPRYGVSVTFPIGDLTDFSNYCIANNIFYSPALTDQTNASNILSDLLDCANSAAVCSEGVLKIIPYGDSEISGNGVTWTPSITPVYHLTDSDYICTTGEDPVKVTRARQADAYNQVQVEFLNRTNQYNIQIAEAKDQADIEVNGLRSNSVLTYHMLCDSDIAQHIAQLRLQRLLYVRNTYEFKLGWPFCLLEPMDVVALNDEGLGLVNFPVRITEISEEANGTFTIRAEEFPVGVFSAPQHPAPPSGGFSHDGAMRPGDVNPPLIFEPPLSLTNNTAQVWAAISGSAANWGGCNIWVSADDSTYQKIGHITGPARYGVTTGSIDARTGSNPDIINNLNIALNTNSQLLAGSTADVDSYATACYVDGEIFAYRDSTLTSAKHYELAYLNRGLYGSAASAHASGVPFARLDTNIFKYAYSTNVLGTTIYLKFTSFNIYNQQEQSLSEVVSYPYSVVGAPPSTVPNLVIQNYVPVNRFNGDEITVQWGAVPGATYKIRVVGYSNTADQYAQTGSTFLRDATSTINSFTYTRDMAIGDGVTSTIIPGAPACRFMTFYVVSTLNGHDSAPIQVFANKPPSVAVTGAGAITGAVSGEIQMHWDPMGDTSSGSHYMVYASTSNPPAQISGNLVYSGNIEDADITGLTPATTYYLIAALVNDNWGTTAGTSDFSAVISATSHA